MRGRGRGVVRVATRHCQVVDESAFLSLGAERPRSVSRRTSLRSTCPRSAFSLDGSEQREQMSADSEEILDDAVHRCKTCRWAADLTRISDLPVVPYRQDQSPRPDFWGSDVRHHTTADDTRWVNYSTRRFSSRSTAF